MSTRFPIKSRSDMFALLCTSLKGQSKLLMDVHTTIVWG